MYSQKIALVENSFDCKFITASYPFHIQPLSVKPLFLFFELPVDKFRLELRLECEDFPKDYPEDFQFEFERTRSCSLFFHTALLNLYGYNGVSSSMSLSYRYLIWRGFYLMEDFNMASKLSSLFEFSEHDRMEALLNWKQ